ncbi:MAG: response regulator [Anaerolineales bacterium]|nr:response regulator [Anaerolineales bacterium]
MPRILIAEDEPDIRNLITFTHRFAGYEVIATADGAQVYAKAQELAAKNELPDLILMDVRMPRMTGYEACAQIKSHPELKNIPVAFLSAKGQNAEIQTGLDAGAVAYIIKPFAPDQLTAKVKELLARS